MSLCCCAWYLTRERVTQQGATPLSTPHWQSQPHAGLAWGRKSVQVKKQQLQPNPRQTGAMSLPRGAPRATHQDHITHAPAFFQPCICFPTPSAVARARDQQKGEVLASPPPNRHWPSLRSTLHSRFDTAPDAFASNRSHLQRRCRQKGRAEPPWWLPRLPASVPVPAALGETTRRLSAGPCL